MLIAKENNAAKIHRLKITLWSIPSSTLKNARAVIPVTTINKDKNRENTLTTKQALGEFALTKHELIAEIGVKHAGIHLIIISQTITTIKKLRSEFYYF
ncbi:hypothetical protein [Chlamydia felis]|uniref:hypothetical protein n=1 Tax=Chlamydia felis TaxID=83556 RepID=UPI00059C5CDB|nr:hypothetical protein [Chlamydia felis]